MASAERWRVIRAVEPDFPAFYRVIWTDHVAEFSDLPPADRDAIMAVVVAVEQTLRRALSPTKINLATLGNVVPHLHWHVIARFDWDSHFPNPVWGERRRTLTGTETAEARLAVPLPELDALVREAVRALA